MPGILVTGATMQDPDRSIVPAINTWTRLEALPLSADLEPALQAAIADPLWLLCRQWQFLEFAGEDAGTPIEVRVEGERALLSRYLPGTLGSDAAARARDYSSEALPLEVSVEREPIRERHPRLAAEAGVHLQWMINVGRLNDAFIAAYPLEIAAGKTLKPIVSELSGKSSPGAAPSTPASSSPPSLHCATPPGSSRRSPQHPPFRLSRRPRSSRSCSAGWPGMKTSASIPMQTTPGTCVASSTSSWPQRA